MKGAPQAFSPTAQAPNAPQVVRPQPGPPPVPKPILGMQPAVFAILLSVAFFVLLAAILGGVFNRSKTGHTASREELEKMAELQRQAVAEADKKRAAAAEAAALIRQQEQAADQATPGPKRSAAAPQSAQPPDVETRFEDCRAKLKKAQQLELLYNLEIQGAEPLVVVGPTFYTVPFDTKQNFADTINCFLMTGQAKYINFDLRDYRTNEVVAVYRYGKLKMK